MRERAEGRKRSPVEGTEKSKAHQYTWFWFFLLPTVLAGATVVLSAAWQADGSFFWLHKPRLNAVLQTSKSTPGITETCSCTVPKLVGMVDDCCCDYHTVDTLNQEVLHPLLQELITQPFFRYFKVRLWCNCPFWPDDGMCHLRDCSVCECEDEDLPEPFRKTQKKKKVKASDDPTCQEGSPNSAVNRSLEGAFKGWMEVDNPWTHDDESKDTEMTYVNLLLNPERYTGYKGVSARRVWEAIYAENCFKDGLQDSCDERRIFYRLISGFHTSVTVHIAANFLLDEQQGLWGPNIDIYKYRIAAFPERLQNLYFTYLFVLRAVTKSSNFLLSAEYDTGNPAEDKHTKELVQMIVNHPRLASACPLPFDEGRLWKGEDGEELKRKLMGNFRNISSILDCTGCEKCRLWGKLQILGLATALKSLFSADSPSQLELQRNEVIALVNLLARLSESMQAVADMSRLLQSAGEDGEEGFKPPSVGGAKMEDNLKISQKKFSAILPS